MTMKAALRNYQARMQRVLDYIDQHLDGDLDLDTVSGIAAFSKFHFHRQFMATFEVSVHRYVQLARLKRASNQLANGAESVTGIAMDAGYESPDAFARAFRQRFGQSPSAFRKSPDWAPWLAAFGPLEIARSKLMDTEYSDTQVEIRDVAATPVAVLEHRGDRARLNETIEKFIRWRKEKGLSPETSSTFNIFRSERTPANPDDYSMDMCVGTAIEADDDVMKRGEIPGGRCAVLRVNGASHNLEPAALYLYRDWLPESGEEARDFPIYCQRYINFRPDAAEHEVVAELFLPLK
jgi:AraC family transcriptional regulator